MKFALKESLILLTFILLVPVGLAQQVVQVQQPQPEKTGFFSQIGSILTSPLTWGIVVFIIIGIVVVFLVIILVRWLIKVVKSRNDLFYKLKSERLRLSKIHKRYPSKAWFKVEKNTPIRLVRKVGDKVTISNPIAYHRGDYTTHEGNTIISLNLIGNKKWFLFPITDILIIPHKKEIPIEVKKNSPMKNEKETISLKNIPSPDKIIQFNDNEILLFAESLSNTGQFLVPVLKDKEGNILDMSLPVYEVMKNVAITEYLYAQTDEFSKLAKEGMNINPFIRGVQKVQDAGNTSVELPPS